MSRLLIEHLPRLAATYEATPFDYEMAKKWLGAGGFISLIRTTELIAAVGAGMGLTVTQSDAPVTLRPGDEALFISLSFGVLLAWAQGGITPLPEDWRSVLLTVRDPADPERTLVQRLALDDELLSGEPI